jgi:hypothetical protein
MKTIKILILISLPFLFSACPSLYRPVRTDELNGLQLHLNDDAVKLKKSAGIIDSESVKIKVKQEATKIYTVAENLIQKDLTAKKIKEYTETLETNIESLMNEKSRKIDNFFFLGICAGSIIFAGGIAFTRPSSFLELKLSIPYMLHRCS